MFAAGGSLVLIATVNWFFLLPALIFLVFLLLLRTALMPAARSLKRLEGASKFSDFLHNTKSYQCDRNVLVKQVTINSIAILQYVTKLKKYLVRNFIYNQNNNFNNNKVFTKILRIL